MNGFDDLMLLLRLVSDPEAHKARLEELQAAIDAAAAEEAGARRAHAELEGERDRLAKVEAGLREKEVAVYVSERKHAADLEAMKTWLLEQRPNRLIAVGPAGGLTKEPDLTEIAGDPIDDPMAEEALLEPLGPGAVQTRHPKSLRRVRI